MQLYFIRHGQSEANVLNEFSNRGEKHPLTEVGVRQVSTLAERLASHGIDHVFSSPILRARQSAEILAGALGVEWSQTAALVEYDVGTYEGRSDPEAWAHHWQVADEWLRFGRWKQRLPEGESFEDIAARFVPLVDGFRGESGDRRYVLLGHGGLYRLMLPLVLANVDFSWAHEAGLGHTDFVRAERYGPSFVCTQWGERSVQPDEFLVGDAFLPNP